MQMIGLARLGRDCELRTTPSGEKVTNLSLAFNYGRKPQGGGDRPTQWVEGVLWGKRAEVLVDYLRKGQQVVVTLDDPRIEEYQGRNGTGQKLVGTVTQLELAGGRPEQSGSAPAPDPAAAPRPSPAPAPARQSGGFNDADDDIPF